MSFFQKALGVTTALASIRGTYAKLDLSQKDNMVVYWGMYATIRYVNYTY